MFLSMVFLIRIPQANGPNRKEDEQQNQQDDIIDNKSKPYSREECNKKRCAETAECSENTANRTELTKVLFHSDILEIE